VAEPGVRPGAAVGDPTPAEVDGPGEVRRPAVAAVQGQGPGVPGGPGAKAGRAQAGDGQTEAQAPQVRPAADPPLAAHDLRERPPRVEPEVFILLRTGSFCVALTLF